MNGPYHNKALPNGTVLREWRLEQVLGVGGFGIVYRGRGVYFDELVAIKEYFPGAISDRLDGTTVAPTDSSSEETYHLGLQKFVEEAKVLWNLSKPTRHPNIACVRSLFEIHGTAYMVMDFESGVSLSQMLRVGRKFDEKGLLGVIRPIADGLDRAHKAGVLHRDIKPANILIAEENRPVLIDFGSARFDSGQATSTKVTFYTPPYAAIEQYVKTYPQGPWTDIYALGVVLYQCVTGTKPPEVLERLHAELGEPLSAREWPGFSQTFTRAVDAAMGIRPSERPQNIPDWLRLFELTPEASAVAEATRIAVAGPQSQAIEAQLLAALTPQAVRSVKEREPATRPKVHESNTRPKVIREPATKPNGDEPAAKAKEQEPVANTKAREPSVETKEQKPAPQARVRLPIPKTSPFAQMSPTMWATWGAAGLAILAAVFSLWPAHHANAPIKTAQKPAHAVAVAMAAKPKVEVAVHAALDKEIDAMIAAAQAVNRPEKEISALTDAKNNLLTLSGNVRAAKLDKAKAQAASALSAAANDMAGTEIEALNRAIKHPWKEIQQINDAPSDAANVIGAVKTAKDKFEAAAQLAESSNSADGTVNATRDALSAFGEFETSYAQAEQYLAPVKKNALAQLSTSARSLSDDIVALAGSAQKPWFLASGTRKDAYQLLQDNAARAREQSSALDQLSASSSSDIKQIDAAITRAASIKQTLSRLLESSRQATSTLAQ